MAQRQPRRRRLCGRKFQDRRLDCVVAHSTENNLVCFVEVERGLIRSPQGVDLPLDACVLLVLRHRTICTDTRHHFGRLQGAYQVFSLLRGVFAGLWYPPGPTCTYVGRLGHNVTTSLQGEDMIHLAVRSSNPIRVDETDACLVVQRSCWFSHIFACTTQ